MRSFTTVLLCLFSLLTASIADFTPEVSKTLAKHISESIVYFDDSPVVLSLNGGVLRKSEDDGAHWKDVLKDIDTIVVDKIKKDRAFAFTNGDTHYVTNNQGKSWEKFNVGLYDDINYEVNVNSKDPNKVLLAFIHCANDICTNDVLYTLDGFKTNPQLLQSGVSYCTFTKSNGVFDQGHDDRILCLKSQRDSHGYIKKTEMFASNDFFKSGPEIVNDNTGTLAGNYVLELRVVQTFIVAVVQSDKYDSRGSSIFLYVSKNGSTFNKAIIDGNINVNYFAILPSTPGSLHISTFGVTSEKIEGMKPGTQVGNILVSDSDGLHFRDLLGRVETNSLGFLNLEKIETVEGVWTANVLEGYDTQTLAPLARTKITFNDGRTWRYLSAGDSCPGDEKCGLNLLSLEERRGDGQSATGATPGILLGIGNTGNGLDKNILNYHTYASRDGGLTWSKVLEDPTVFAFGDLGNVIVASPYSKEEGNNMVTSKIYYSLDQAETWKEYDFDMKSFPYLLTTTIDGTSAKFLYAGLYREGDSQQNQEVIYSLDFSKAFSRTCDDSDLETWYGRADAENKEGTCFSGHKDIYHRRKQDAECFVNKVFEDLKIEEVPCECSEEDYECGFGYEKKDDGTCAPDYSILRKLCQGKDAITVQTKKKVDGNLCTGGKVQPEDFQFQCKEINARPAVSTSENKFAGNIASYIFLDQTEASLADETLILRTTRNEAYISHDGGREFHKLDLEDEVYEIYLNPYFPDEIFLITTGNKIHASRDRGNTFRAINTPSDINGFGLQILKFSNTSRQSFIFFGDHGCEDPFSEQCQPAAFITLDGGNKWDLLTTNTRTCDFVGSRYTSTGADEHLIYCQVRKGDNYALVSSNDYFKTTKDEFEKIVGFATTGGFTVVATLEGDSLKAVVTVDGVTFADALFPSDFKVNKQQAYTVLGSESGAIFLHVTSNDRKGSEYGAILKSNSNGTSYVLSQRFVNRNEIGFVDYEKVEGLEGIALINTVINHEEAKSGSLKQLKSRITFNDGSDWDYIHPPSQDSEGKKYECIGKSLEDCSLNLHGYTERKDFRDTFSSGSATGVLLGVGNVGKTLGPFKESSVFLTRDGGNTWKEVKKGVYQWEYGDRGSIIVLVNDSENTNVIYYSLDEGENWNEYQFADDTVKVDDIVTVPADNSKRFLLIARSESSRGDESRTFTIDFSDVFTRQCVLDLDNPDNDDFTYWSPKHPFSSANCLFGHEVKYLRKITSHTDCFIGAAPLGEAAKFVRNCACTRQDFECDFNYVKANDGTCKLINGLQPDDHSEICKIDKNAVEYYEPTGYRKIPLSTCEGGQEFDKVTAIPCPGREREFGKEHGGRLSGFGLFIVIVFPIAVFVFTLWFVYDRGIRRNGGFQRFGEIRLGEEDDLIENDTTDKVVNTIIRGGITVIAAAIATFKMIQIVDAALINKFKSIIRRQNRYTQRGAAYTSVQTEEGFRDHEDEEDILNDVIDDEDYEIEDDEVLTEPEVHDEFEQYEDDRNLE